MQPVATEPPVAPSVSIAKDGGREQPGDGVTAPGDHATLAPSAWAALRVRQWPRFLPLAAGALLTPSGADLVALLTGTTVAACSLAFAYGLNSITDRRSDLLVDKNPLAGRTEVPSGLPALLVVLALGALALGAWIGAVALGATVLSLLAGLAYSSGPRLKGRPGLSLLGNGMIFMPLLAASVSVGPLGGAWFAAAALLAALLTQNQLVHELADAAEDLRAGDRTSAGWLGPQRTVLLARLLGLGAGAVWAALTADALALGVGIVVLLGSDRVLATAADAATKRRRHRWVAFLGGSAAFAALYGTVH